MIDNSLAGTRCISLLRRYGNGSEHSRPFEDFPPELRARLVAQAGLTEGEEPAVACVLALHTWTLLTTRRLIWCREGIVQSLTWEEIEYSDPDEEELLPEFPQPDRAHKSEGEGDPLYEGVLASAAAKRQWERLLVFTKGGKAHKLQLEPIGFRAFCKAISVMIMTSKRK